MTNAVCPEVPAQINTNCAGSKTSNTVGSLYLRKSSFHKLMKPFSFLISCKKHVESKLSLYADLEPRNHSDASLEILKIDKMD